jgi:hypothetical protein
VATILSDIQATDKTGQRTQGQMLLEWYDKRGAKPEPTSPVDPRPALVISEDDDDVEDGGMLAL